MDYAEMRNKIAAMKADIDQMLAATDLEPCMKAGLESTKAHVDLLCIELMLDVE